MQSVPVLSDGLHASELITHAPDVGIRLVHHSTKGELLHLKEINAHILLGGIVKARWIAIEAVDS